MSDKHGSAAAHTMNICISKISLVVFVVLLVLSFFLLSVVGDFWPWYAVMSAFAVVPLVAGPRRYRLFGAIALALSGFLMVNDIAVGMHLRARVSEERQQATRERDKFQQAFAQLDAAIHAGMTFSNAAAILPGPPVMLTNNDDTVDAYYTFMPRHLEHVNWLTNGITLHISNAIVIRKTYTYMSSP